MKKYLTILALSGVLCGCKSPGHVDPGVLSHITLGMTKEQVIEAVGRPESDSAEANKETLYYVEERPWWQWKRMQVKLVDGKVVSYGEVGAK